MHIKSVDNSDLWRQADPQDRVAWRRVVTLGFLMLLVLLASYAPRALLRQTGYRLEKLQQQHQALTEFNEQLKVRHAMMTDPRRITELASKRGLEATPPGRFAWQDRTIAPVESNEVAQTLGQDHR